MSSTNISSLLQPTEKAPAKIIAGGFFFSADEPTWGGGGNADSTFKAKLLDILKENNVPIDTARIYPSNEDALGELEVGKKGLVLHTKTPPSPPGANKKEAIIQSAKDSLAALKVSQVDLLYVHAPDTDPANSIETTVDAYHELYQQGVFKQWGISNFLAPDIQRFYDYSTSIGLPPPAYYQGSYSLVTRRVETQVFPILRKLNIAFVGYSPLAGGLLVKTSADLAAAKGRWDSDNPLGEIYRSRFDKPEYHAVTEAFGQLAKETGNSRVELALRWLRWHSLLDGNKGDAVLFGLTKMEQFDAVWRALQAGPLEEEVVKKLEGLWDLVKDVAPLDNFN